MAVEDRYGKKPLLTDEEWDAQYRTVYTRASRKRSSAEVNLVSFLFSELQPFLAMVPFSD